MQFKDSRVIQSLSWNLRLYEVPRSKNRALINDLFNGLPPFSQAELEDDLSATNVNFLHATNLAHDARKNFSNALLKPSKYFTVSLNCGPVHKRSEWASIITEAINRPMKRSLEYFEVWRSTIASLVLHGIAPKIWPDRESWCPEAVGIDDVLVPGNTLVSMKNLPFFAVTRRYTAYQIIELTQRTKRDPGWNMDVVNDCLKWADDEMVALNNTQWTDVWQPERISERLKENAGLYAGDDVPTIQCIDWYYWSREARVDGWRRRIVLDAWGGMGAGGTPIRSDAQGEFLFDPGDRIYGKSREEIAAFQFADLSSVAPLRYHSVRSLGFLLYAVCHLQNRLLCKLNDSIFESLMQYFRVASDDEVARALKVDLINKGFIDKSIQFVRPEERWKVDMALAELGIQLNSDMMGRNSASMVQDANVGSNRDEHMKATVWIGRQQQANALVSAALQQSYQYAEYEYREILRRFCIPNSKDPDVRKFRLECLRSGVPEKYLDIDAMDVLVEQVMGSGNSTIEGAIAQQLMGFRNLYSPEAQQIILRKATLAITGDAELSDRLVPEQQTAGPGVLDAQKLCGALIAGLHVDIGPAQNHQEVIQVLLGELMISIKQAQQIPPSMERIAGLANMASYAQQHIDLLAQDPQSTQQAKTFAKDLAQINKAIAAMAQQVQAQQQQPAGNPEVQKEMELTKAKADSMKILAATKAEIARGSHAQKTAQRATQSEIKMGHDAEKDQQNLETQAQRDALALNTQAEKDRLALEKEARTPAKESEPN